MIPRHLIFGAAAVSMVRISPDGAWLAWLAPHEDVIVPWVAPVADPAAAVALPAGGARGVQWLAWAGTSRHLLILDDRDGDEHWRLCALDIASGALTPLTAYANARFLGASEVDPAKVAVALADRDPRWHDVYTIDVTTGTRELVFANDARLFGFVLDRALVPRFALRAEPVGRTIVAIGVRDMRTIAAEDELSTWLVGVEGTRLYAVSSEGRDTAALVAYDGATRTELAEDPEADIVAVVRAEATGVPIATRADLLVPRWSGLDWLTAIVGPVCEVVSQSRDDARWVVATSEPGAPVCYWLAEPALRTATRWRSSRPALTGTAPMTPAIVRSRDGLPLVTYTTASASGPLPTVVWVHGGPWQRDDFAFAPLHAWLADRGYAVLSINFRGSTGFGKAFLNAGDREWGRRMHDDLLDGIAHAVAAGIADPARIAIAGGSYGGYAALVGMTATPDVFACGISICGPANLETSQVNKPAYWAAVTEMRARRIGDPRTEDGRALLRERSPIHRASQIRRPLLVAHGANDPRVTRGESDRMVEAALANGVPTAYLVFRDEGHGLVRPANRIAFYAAVEAFLARHLGGRAEPIGDAFDSAALDIIAGAELLR